MGILGDSTLIPIFCWRGVECGPEAAMRFRATLVLPLCLTLSAWAQLTFTVPVVDQSDFGSPLEISGTASFTEKVVANSVTTSSEYLVTARNASGRGIVLLVAYFDEAGPRGGGTHHILQFDNLFRPEFGPGESFVLARSDPGNRSSFCCVNPLWTADEPKAEVRVQFVQFSDGSTFGVEATAKDILAIRSVVSDRLHRLDGARSDQEFLQLLEQKIQPDAADAFFEAVRNIQKAKGTAAARNQVRSGLANAEKHLAASRITEAGIK